MNRPTNIKISVFSTGRVKIRPKHIGPTRLPELLWLISSRSWTSPKPINVYVIQHPKGIVVFDLGQDIASITDKEYFPRGIIGWLYSRLARFEISKSQTFIEGLSRLDISPRDISLAVISHLHQDHIGGLRYLDNRVTSIVVHPDEVADAIKVGSSLKGYLKQHIFLPNLKFRGPDFHTLGDSGPLRNVFGWDIFDDESLIILHTPGHTSGSLSLLVRSPNENPILLVGDLTYDVTLLSQGFVPGVGHRSTLKKTSNWLLELMSSIPELLILAAHDPNADQLLNASKAKTA